MTQSYLGKKSPVTYKAKRTWDFANDEQTETLIKGPAAAVQALYDLYKVVAHGNAEYAGLEFDPGYGVGRLLIRTVSDGNAVYELFGNEFSKPLDHHKYWDDMAASRDEVADLMVWARGQFEAGVNMTASGLTSADKKLTEYYRHLCYGVTDLPEAGLFIRISQTISKRSTLRASYAGMNTVQPLPNVTALNSLLAGLPKNWEWLKKTPQVVTVGPSKWRLVQEYWGAEKWSVALGGTWLKNT